MSRKRSRGSNWQWDASQTCEDFQREVEARKPTHVPVEIIQRHLTQARAEWDALSLDGYSGADQIMRELYLADRSFAEGAWRTLESVLKEAKV